MLLEIKDRFSGRVIFAHDVESNTMLETVKAALKAGADLDGANLRGANLRCANLRCANLRCADLRCADLRGADLDGADLRCVDLRCADLRCADLRGADLDGADLRCVDLRGANLRCANLRGANLYGANLYGANLYGANLYEEKKLSGKRPFFQLGPIGSRSDYLLAFTTDSGVVLKAGCFTGSIEEFESSLDETHGSNNHGKEYRAALALIRSHVELWPADKVENKEAA